MASRAAQCDETVILGTPDETGTQAVYSEVMEASNPLRFSICPGLAKPLSSESGQVLLAYAPPDRRAAYLDEVRFARLAPRTITSAPTLRRTRRSGRKALR